MSETKTGEEIREVVREKYGAAARQVKEGARSSCCGPVATSCCGTAPSASGLSGDPITRDLYGLSERASVPDAALSASLGCGNPTALAQLREGEVVLDLGSGGGIDVLLSARRVGSAGKAYGLDMTDEMLELARENQRKSGLSNVEFLKGTIEEIPLPDASVDVIVSNCVINLAADKDRVLREAFRVLKPGGRFAVSDVVTKGEVPAPIKRSVELWIGCVAGALSEDDYAAKLARAGFTDVTVEPTRIYRVDDAREFLASAGIDVDALGPEVDGKFRSAFVRAVKPDGASDAPPLSDRDFGAVRDLLSDSDLSHEDLSPGSMRDFVGLRGEDGLQAVAGLELHGSEALLRSVATTPAARGTGLGKKVTAAAEARARRAGVARLWLLTETAEGFFARLGWARAARDEAPPSIRETTQFTSLCPASAALMVKRLS